MLSPWKFFFSALFYIYHSWFRDSGSPTNTRLDTKAMIRTDSAYNGAFVQPSASIVSFPRHSSRAYFTSSCMIGMTESRPRVKFDFTDCIIASLLDATDVYRPKKRSDISFLKLMASSG